MIQLLLLISLCELVASKPAYERFNLVPNSSPGELQKESDKIFSGYSFSKMKNVSENRSLVVRCEEKNWRIVVKREFFGSSLPFSPQFVRLGEGESAAKECGPQTDFLSATRMIISAGLKDCGSKSWVSDDWLIYSNKLVFSVGPLLTLDGVLIFRRVHTVVPIECHYKRKFRVSAEPLRPTWLPVTSTIEAAGLLHVSLHIVKDASGSARQSTLFQQGEPLFLEAAVHAPMHSQLQIYVDHCVATSSSDPFSEPSNEFISNHGCLVDSLLPNSFSKFYIRPKESVLRFSLQTFNFPEDERKQVFINCQLRVAPHHSPPDAQSKACYFHGPSLSWHSVEGNNTVCLCCETGDCKAAMMESKKYLEEEQNTVSVGPLQILPTNSHLTGKLAIVDGSFT